MVDGDSDPGGSTAGVIRGGSKSGPEVDDVPLDLSPTAAPPPSRFVIYYHIKNRRTSLFTKTMFKLKLSIYAFFDATGVSARTIQA